MKKIPITIMAALFIWLSGCGKNTEQSQNDPANVNPDSLALFAAKGIDTLSLNSEVNKMLQGLEKQKNTLPKISFKTEGTGYGEFFDFYYLPDGILTFGFSEAGEGMIASQNHVFFQNGKIQTFKNTVLEDDALSEEYKGSLMAGNPQSVYRRPDESGTVINTTLSGEEAQKEFNEKAAYFMESYNKCLTQIKDRRDKVQLMGNKYLLSFENTVVSDDVAYTDKISVEIDKNIFEKLLK